MQPNAAAAPAQRVSLTKQDGRFVALCTFDARAIPKAARFRWDPAAKQWWTADPTCAAKLIEYADDTCRAELQDAIAAHAAALDASRATDADVEIPVPAGLAYLPYQRAGIAFAASRPGTLLADEMGLGKTPQSVGVLNLDDTLNRVIVVCPASLRINWKRELQKWLVRPLRVELATSKAWPDADVVIINYDILHRHAERLRATEWDALIVDEAHYCKNSKTRRAKQTFAIKARRRVFLTGTPLVNRPRELFPLINALDPKTWPAFFPFGLRYCNGFSFMVGREKHWDFSGASNLDELQERLRSSIMVRRLKRDVLTDLPPKTRQVIELPANGAAEAIDAERQWWERSRAHIEQLAAAVELAKAADTPEAYEQALAELNEAVTASFTDMSRVRQETARAKVPYVIEHVERLLDDDAGKVVVFGHHKAVIRAIAEAFGAAAVTITGDTPLLERQAAVDRFQTDPSCTVFVGGILAAGVGLTLTASSTVVFAELDWVPGNVTQAEDRTHRLGQRSHVLVQHLVLEGSIDCALAKAIVDKQQVADAALDKARDGAPLLTAPVAPLPPRAQPSTRNAKRDEIAAIAAHVSPELCAMIHGALRLLAGMCDGAQTEDGVGFNKIDTAIGTQLAHLPRLTPKQAVLGSRMVIFYRRQVGAAVAEAVKAGIAEAKAKAGRDGGEGK